MLGAGELPEEFTGPVAYDDRWLWIAIALAALVVAYYALTWRLTRAPRPEIVAAPTVDVGSARALALARVDDVERAVREGGLSARAGHQRLSEVVRAYVEQVSALPARSMALADFRAIAPPALTGAIELMYPPEFGPDETFAERTFADAAAQARTIVERWG